ncbi:MAG: tripartite tricarboxylate transporter TctB family protein [Betaproteobacteria bacterium]|nr:tripartite tricarboxylate transporter TctB family protein [Betaproteobacteria bacterium]MCC7216418.1 tripartite tricarboxylate transporter TctB family protein [Burkholderiales bacterium]
MSGGPYPVAPRSDLNTALVWVALGAAIVVASWRMERMTAQGADLYTAPGLWPGVVGLALALLGGLLAWRSLVRAREAGWDAAAPRGETLVPTPRFALAAGLFLVYALLGVGRGLPFWLSTALFVAAFVFLFRRANRKVGDATGSDRGDAVLAVVCGVATAAVVTLVFEQLFFVRLP